MTTMMRVGRISSVRLNVLTMATAPNAAIVDGGDQVRLCHTPEDEMYWRGEVTAFDRRAGTITLKKTTSLDRGDQLFVINPKRDWRADAFDLGYQHTAAPMNECILDALLDRAEAGVAKPATAHVNVADFVMHVRQSGAEIEELKDGSLMTQMLTPLGAVTLLSDARVPEGRLWFGEQSFDRIRMQETYELCERTAVALMERMAELKKLMEGA